LHELLTFKAKLIWKMIFRGRGLPRLKHCSQSAAVNLVLAV